MNAMKNDETSSNKELKNQDAKKSKLQNIKLPPHSIEAEQAVLGSLMLDNQRWDVVAEMITDRDFYSRHHQLIFSEMHTLVSRGTPIDLITLSESLESKDLLIDVGGFAYLAELSKNTPSAINVVAYTDIIRQQAILRELISASNEIADNCYSTEGRDSTEILDLAESKIFQIAESRTKQGEGPKNITDVLEATVAKIEELFQRPHDGVTGVSTGFLDLDKKTAGLQRSDLIIIAARPSMGKTTFAMNLCENAAMMQEKPVLIFSLEMPSEQIMTSTTNLS